MINGSLPPGWTLATLDQVANIVRGVSFPTTAKRKAPAAGHIACLRTTNVQHEVEWDDLWYIPEEHVRREEQHLRELDVLISTANSYELVGKVAIVHALREPATLGAFISLIRFRPGISAKFAYYQLTSHVVASRMREMASTTTNISNISTRKLGGLELRVARDSTARAKLTLAAHEVARKTLNLEDVRIACIPVAPLAEQAEIAAEVDRRLSVADAAEMQVERALQRAARLRQAILKRAFEGRLVPQIAHLRRNHPLERLSVSP